MTILRKIQRKKFFIYRSEVKQFLFLLYYSLLLAKDSLPVLGLPIGGPLGECSLSAYDSFLLSQCGVSGYVEAGGSCSYRDPPLHFNLLLLLVSLSLSLSFFQKSLFHYLERERDGQGRRRQKMGEQGGVRR